MLKNNQQWQMPMLIPILANADVNTDMLCILTFTYLGISITILWKQRKKSFHTSKIFYHVFRKYIPPQKNELTEESREVKAADLMSTFHL